MKLSKHRVAAALAELEPLARSPINVSLGFVWSTSADGEAWWMASDGVTLVARRLPGEPLEFVISAVEARRWRRFLKLAATEYVLIETASRGLETVSIRDEAGSGLTGRNVAEMRPVPPWRALLAALMDEGATRARMDLTRFGAVLEGEADGWLVVPAKETEPTGLVRDGYLRLTMPLRSTGEFPKLPG